MPSSRGTFHELRSSVMIVSNSGPTPSLPAPSALPSRFCLPCSGKETEAGVLQMPFFGRCAARDSWDESGSKFRNVWGFSLAPTPRDNGVGTRNRERCDRQYRSRVLTMFLDVILACRTPSLHFRVLLWWKFYLLLHSRSVCI